MRAIEGGLERQDKQGGTYRLFGFDSEKFKNQLKDRPAEEVKPERASDAQCDSVYSTLLDMLELNEEHQLDLESRGLDHTKLMCCTWRHEDQFRVVNELQRIFGEAVLLRVPGFYLKESQNGKMYLAFSCVENSMIVPVTNKDRQVVALKARLPDEMAAKLGQRYIYSSSKSHGGPSCGNHLYVPLAVDHDSIERYGGALRITEGELKAEVGTLLSIPTIGVPGVSAWQVAREYVLATDPKIVVVAYDSDASENPHVMRAKNQLIEWCETNGFLVHDEQWSIGKGVDDALTLGIGTSWTPFEAEYRKVRRYMRTKVRETICHDNDACRWLWEQALPKLSGDTANPVTIFETFLRRLHKGQRTPLVNRP